MASQPVRAGALLYQNPMKHPLLHTCLLGLCLLLPSCEGLDPAMLGAANGGGYQGGYDRPVSRPVPYGGYDRGYDRAPSYGSGGYYREPERPYYNSSDRDRDHYSSSGNSRDKNYFGGPQEWYKSGYGVGKKDRKEGKPNDYRRHKNQYDGKTQSQFAAGYEDGYNR